MEQKDKYEIRNLVKEEIDEYVKASNLVSIKLASIAERVESFSVSIDSYEKELDEIKEIALRNKQQADNDRLITNRNYSEEI